MSGEQRGEYRIDDLSRESGVSVRNIRVYQDRGLLPAPTIRGRTGWYRDAHLTRLNLISRMLDRGYNFQTISELLTAAKQGWRVEHVLAEDPGSVTPNRWTTLRRTANITIAELKNRFSGQATDELIARSRELGLIWSDGRDMIEARPELLATAESLVGSGISLEAVLGAASTAKTDMDDVAAVFTKLIADRYIPADIDYLDLPADQVSELAKLVDTVRVPVVELVASLFADAMDRHVSDLLGMAADKLTHEAPSPAARPKK